MKSVYIKLVTVVLILVSMISCTEEITLEVNHEPQLIIHGTLSQETDVVEISIQQSVPLNSNLTHNPVNDASIELFAKDSSGNVTLVTNSFTVNEGDYSSSNEITPIIGHQYWIEVTLADGTKFVSEAELLKPVVAINSVTITSEDLVEIEFSDPGNDSNFYTFWVVLLNNDDVVSVVRSESNDVIFNGNNEATVELDLYNFEEDDSNQNLVFNQAIIALQNINSTSYQFYLNQTQQQEASDSEGSGDPSQLFATPPVNLLGNITNITTQKRALGNFTVLSQDFVIQGVTD